MSDSSIRFGQPQRVPDLRSAKLWTLDWCDQTFGPDVEFRYFICEKQPDGSTLIHGQADTTRDAFRLRKQMAEELNAKLFIRARRIQPRQLDAHADDDAALDQFKCWYSEGVSTQDVPPHLRSEYQAFLGRRGRSAR